MAVRFDDIKKGLIFGALFGFIATLVPWVKTNIVDWAGNLFPETWQSSSFGPYLGTIVFIVIGAIIGAYIDAK